MKLNDKSNTLKIAAVKRMAWFGSNKFKNIDLENAKTIMNLID